mmetsp:Transcript_17101/g.47415  ORF Transcript_17101/g.47415 Transcript_17101/m.47415 type:complete len:82 (-) Transcript_17101:275-520(-)
MLLVSSATNEPSYDGGHHRERWQRDAIVAKVGIPAVGVWTLHAYNDHHNAALLPQPSRHDDKPKVPPWLGGGGPPRRPPAF